MLPLVGRAERGGGARQERSLTCSLGVLWGRARNEVGTVAATGGKKEKEESAAAAVAATTATATEKKKRNDLKKKRNEKRTEFLNFRKEKLSSAFSSGD